MDGKKKNLFHVVMGLTALFLAVILAVSAIGKLGAGSVVPVIMGFAGMVLFGGASLVLLIGELRQWLKDRRK